MSLPWDRFSELEGDPTRNFELLCRGLVQRNYGRFGQLRSRRQQPGVEFHLNFHRDCDLGAAGDWFGWQCRWYDLPKDRSLGEQRRVKIKDALEKAKADIEGLTDFVLCLRELPRKADLDWYFGLESGVRLHLWADDEIETRLTGNAEVLRQTYFGELIFSAEQLAEAHERAIEPLKQRWVPQLHVSTSVEEDILVALARPESAQQLQAQADLLEGLARRLRGDLDEVVGTDLQHGCEAVGAELAALSARLAAIAAACVDRRPWEARELVGADASPAISVQEVRAVARRLRVQRIPLALAASAVEAEIRFTCELLAEHRTLMTAPLIAVVGDAGRGKTQLGAQLTARSENACAGIFIKGSDLRAGGTLDELSARIPGLNAQTFDELLEAADAAGARGGVRIPVVIDGLNDAERPAEWRTQLAQVIAVLRRYDHVLLLVTLRGAVRDDVLPEGSVEFQLEWEDPNVEEAVERYFRHYKIDPGSSRLPIGLFSTALFLRMFCEAVNPDRSETVGVEALPATLVAVFELYRERTAERLRCRPGHVSLPPGHVEKQLARVAKALWDRGTRDLPFDDVRHLVDGAETDWDESLVRAFEEEGILFRDGAGWGDQRSAVLFDRLAGYLIADVILVGLSITQLDDELSSLELWNRLRGDPEQRHPLAEDVLVALVGLLPRRFYGRQLWKLAPEAARKWALAQTLDLESNLIDGETVDALAELIPDAGPPQWRSRHPFDRLWEVRDGVNHKLNARFLDRVLRSVDVPHRDLRWTEWIRFHGDDLLTDLAAMERRWVETDARDDRDDLDARAAVWLLTSTRVSLRDRATRALQRYGRADPRRLVLLLQDLLDIDDPYVTERALAAAFGAICTHQMPDPGGAFERTLRALLGELQHRFLEPNGVSPSSHRLAREYIAGCFEFAAKLHPDALPEDVDVGNLQFCTGPEPEPIPADDDRARECNHTFGMDFENYVVGSLYEGRRNYQRDHPGFLAGVAEIRGRVWELGWRDALFDEVDGRIRDERWRRHQNLDRIERYGKKYGWIAFYELAGRLDDRGELGTHDWRSDRGVAPDIDPTFPEIPTRVRLALPEWARGGSSEDESWLRDGDIDVPDELLAPDVLDGEDGPWLLVEGYLEHRDEELGRRVFGFFRGVLVSTDDADSLRAQLSELPYLGGDLVPASPQDGNTFAGEIPWSSGFEAAGEREWDLGPYTAPVRERWDEAGIDIELLGHGYCLEASRTSTVMTSGYWVPSHNIAEAFDLRQRPGTLDLVSLDGRVASLTREGPEGFHGDLLYLRRDLLSAYARGRRLIQLAWGEREVDRDWHHPPDWLRNVYLEHADLWRRVEVIDLAQSLMA